ncbi:hypothetical protein CFIMG_002614RA [Ceratocystis fimbriata CBS 114723]|uniref:Uncharacterized protein n=1 Tax=Ceratocystis fimbriata CBS 114723 TaxID=1035309 RepID=A0A2C5X9Y5_9PEZI|nr:hypothetical protein CFIMG_002614RA [Ceratocystis fimbriata CBS 114723]
MAHFPIPSAQATPERCAYYTHQLALLPLIAHIWQRKLKPQTSSSTGSPLLSSPDLSVSVQPQVDLLSRPIQ